MGIQDLTLSMVLIVAVGVFLASFMDAIAGGGGIISVPTYLLAGLPMHVALGTNKLSAGLGSLASTGRYIKSGYVDWKLGVPSILAGIVTNTGLYTVNLMAMGWKSNQSLLGGKTIFTMLRETGIGGLAGTPTGRAICEIVTMDNGEEED